MIVRNKINLIKLKPLNPSLEKNLLRSLDKNKFIILMSMIMTKLQVPKLLAIKKITLTTTITFLNVPFVISILVMSLS